MLMTLARNWWAIVLRGVCAVLFGLAAFAWPGLTLAVLVIMYGAYALVDGIFAVIAAIAARQPGRFPWGVLLAGLAAIGVGVLTFAMPGLTALALLYLIAAWAILRGVFEVIATSGDSMLGGDDFDQRVFCWVVEQAKLAPLAPRDMRLLQVKSREAKEHLTLHGEAPITARLSSGEFVAERGFSSTASSALTRELTSRYCSSSSSPSRASTAC